MQEKEIIRETMRDNSRNRKSNGGALPQISHSVHKIIENHRFERVCWLSEKDRNSIDMEMKTVFEDFCKRYKKYTRSELSSDDMRRIYESFVLEHESIRIYMKATGINNQKYIEKLAQIWDHDFLFKYFGDDAFLAKELGMSEEEVQEICTRSVKLYFAIHNIGDPIEALRRVKHHMEHTLSDENLSQELGMSEEEVQEICTRSVKLHFAIHNISDPIEALRRVKHHMEHTLSDENLSQELGISEEEVQEICTRSVKLRFAINNISNPIEALRRVKHHMEHTLSDENLSQELGMSEEEVQEICTRSVKLRFAIHNIGDPIEALRRVKHHMEHTLSDENLSQELGMSEEEVQEICTRSVKLYFAIHNISNPIEALRRVKHHMEHTLSDENLSQELGMSEEEVQEICTRSVKLYFAIHNIGDPIEALRRVKHHMEHTLSDENLSQELGMSEEEIQEICIRSVKLYFAIHNISDPIEALRRVKHHMEHTLSDENLSQELGISEEEVQEICTRSVKLRFAIHNIGDPIEALRRVKHHMEHTLSDENLSQELGMSEEEVQEICTRSVKLRFAIHNIGDPIEALRRVKHHMEHTLSDENLSQELGNVRRGDTRDIYKKREVIFCYT